MWNEQQDIPCAISCKNQKGRCKVDFESDSYASSSLSLDTKNCASQWEARTGVRVTLKIHFTTALFITLVYIFNISFLFNVRLRHIIFQPLTLHLSPYSNKSWVPLFYCNRGLAISSCLITRIVFRVTIILWPFIFSHSWNVKKDTIFWLNIKSVLMAFSYQHLSSLGSYESS